MPLVFPVLGAQGLARGARLRVKLGAIDEIALDVNGTLLERLDTPPASDTGEDEGEDEPVAGPLAIAVDLNEPEAASADNPPS